MKRPSFLVAVFVALLFSACATAQTERDAQAPPEERDAIERFFKPDYLEERPFWQKFAFWAGPGH